MTCTQCRSEFTPKFKANSLSKYCSNRCNNAAYRARHYEVLKVRNTEYQREHRAQILRNKRKYNRSEKGQNAHKKYKDARPWLMGQYLKRYHSDPYVKAVQLAREKSRRLLKRNRAKACETCGITTGRIECHHKDGNPFNTALSNLEWACNGCHNTFHSEGGGLVLNQS